MKIDDDLVADIQICKSHYFLRRWDVLPFLIMYGAFILASSREVGNIVLLIVFPIILSLQVLLFLLSQWSVMIRFYIGYYRVNSISLADHILVKTTRNAGASKIVPLMTRNKCPIRSLSIAGNSFVDCTSYFEFQKLRYEHNSETDEFTRLSYPGNKVSVSDILSASGGHSSPNDLVFSLAKWHLNFFDIPIPIFLDLYLEHLCAPFFVFQVLCLFLWSLDDYWYYSMFTLLMLLFFEGMLCKQRQNSLLSLKNMRRPPRDLFTLRGGRWSMTSSDELVPGDIISLISNDTAPVVPCDGVLLSGSCVVNEAMLTGESVPQVKESLVNDSTGDALFDIGVEGNNEEASRWKKNLVLAGTSILQHSPESDSRALAAPDGGCRVLVLRTGFGTTQGMLMRKILFSAERISANSVEAFYFIGVLVVFAVLASATVLQHGYFDENRNRFKLVLHCIMIITSVIPPELPMELSLAVTTSLAALGKGLVYCTEPFRIPLAGKVDVVCFDKTGTLTKDRMILDGVLCGQDIAIFPGQPVRAPIAYNPDDKDASLTYTPASASPLAVLTIMSSCHSLVLRSPDPDSYIGDPLEVTTFASSGFQFDSSAESLNHPIFYNSSFNVRFLTLHRYSFSSALKRMSVLVEMSQLSDRSPSSQNKLWYVMCKGAPEVMAKHFKKLPAFYDEVSTKFMSRGKRVLALGCKRVTEREARGSGGPSKVKYIYPRDDAEKDLDFAGFLVFDCQLKGDSKGVIRELVQSAHKVIMITGDSPHTAIDVAYRLEFMKSSVPTLLMEPPSESTGIAPSADKCILKWRDSMDPSSALVHSSVADLSQLSLKYNLCVTGDGLSRLMEQVAGAQPKAAEKNAILQTLCSCVTIFARVTPTQKELIILSLNELGNFTVMCGDGTNDVGALKAAHVGVSIVNNPDFETKIERSLQSGPDGRKLKGTQAKDRMARAMAELNAQYEDHSVIKLGDASIASPFTSRRTSIDSVLSVLRQGRATLVTTVQVFKILALNCLVSAYMMSTLYLRGLKQGDTQMTASGLMTAALFFFLSQAKPLYQLDVRRPQASAFCRSVIVSVAGQFCVHLLCLVFTLHLCEEYISVDDPSMAADGKFQPNIVNSAMYLLATTMQVNNFVVNYRGHPFVQSISENTMLWRSVIFVYCCIVVVVGGQLEPLNDLLQLAPFPSSQFQVFLLATLATNFGASYAIEYVCTEYL